jgi:hypothetical protein
LKEDGGVAVDGPDRVAGSQEWSVVSRKDRSLWGIAVRVPAVNMSNAGWMRVTDGHVKINNSKSFHREDEMGSFEIRMHLPCGRIINMQ